MIKVFTDGGSRGNPGPSAFGFLVKYDGRLLIEEGGYLGIATNNFAEYTAVIEALTWLERVYPKSGVHIYMDSQLAVSQLSGVYKVKNSKIRERIFAIRILETSFAKVSYHFIPREQNREADRLVNLALDRHLKTKRDGV